MAPLLLLLVFIGAFFLFLNMAKVLMLFIFSNKQLLESLIFFFCFAILYFISFCSNCYCLLSSVSLCLICSFCSHFSCRIRSFAWDISSFITQNFITLSFLFSAAIAKLHNFQHTVFSLSFVSRNFLMTFLIYSLILWLFKSLHLLISTYVKFPIVHVQLTYSFIPFYWEKKFGMVLDLLKSCVLTWSILEDVRWTFKKNVYLQALGECMSDSSIGYEVLWHHLFPYWYFVFYPLLKERYWNPLTLLAV